jgi:cytochrome oxidase Cu insertion factor (SCO1/SenC/PrrC family)
MEMRFDKQVILRRLLDVVLIAAMLYAALLAFGVIRRGGRFQEGREAPPLTGIALADGKKVDLADFRGKTVLLDFFSTSCPSCKRILPDVEELQEQGGDRLQVLLVSTDPPEQLRSYLAAEDSRLLALVEDGTAHRAYGVDTIPYLVVIDADGRIRGDFIGDIRWSDVEPHLQRP